jgi:hypothetical protein
VKGDVEVRPLYPKTDHRLLLRHASQGSVPSQDDAYNKIIQIYEPNWSVRSGLIPLLDRTTSLNWGNIYHWLAETLLEQEGEGGNIRNSGRFQEANFY